MTKILPQSIWPHYKLGLLLGGLLLWAFFGGPVVYGQPANDNCNNATVVMFGTHNYGLGIFTTPLSNLTDATKQVLEPFHSTLISAGNDKKTVWYKFTLPVARGVRMELKTTMNPVPSGDAGFTVYKPTSGACMPTITDIEAAKLTPLNKFGNTFNPCLTPGTYYVQIASKQSANFEVFLDIDVTLPGVLNNFDFVTAPMEIGTFPVDLTTSIGTTVGNNDPADTWFDYQVGCQTLDHPSEVCSTLGSDYLDYTQTTWHTFRTDAFLDFLRLEMRRTDGVGNVIRRAFKVGFKLYEGDVKTLGKAGVTQIDGCRILEFSPNPAPAPLPPNPFKDFQCKLKPNTTYSLEIFYHKDTTTWMGLRLFQMGRDVTKAPDPPTIPPVHQLGVLPHSPAGTWTIRNDVFACNSRMEVNSCDTVKPATGYTRTVTYHDPCCCSWWSCNVTRNLKYDLNDWVTFTLADFGNLRIETSGSNLPTLVRLYEGDVRTDCNLTLRNEFHNNYEENCFPAGTYSLQVMGVSSGDSSSNNFLNSYLSHFARPVRIALRLQTSPQFNNFQLRNSTAYDIVNVAAGPPYAMPDGVQITSGFDIFGCGKAVLPAGDVCHANHNRAMYRVIYIGDSDGDGIDDSGTLTIGGGNWNALSYRLYRGNAAALATAQNKFSFPDRITGLVDVSGCQSTYYPFRVCVYPGFYTLVTFADDNDISISDQPWIRFNKYATKFDLANSSKIDIINNSGGNPQPLVAGQVYQSTWDRFSCEKSVLPDGDVCGPNYASTSKAIYRLLRIGSNGVLRVWGGNWWAGHLHRLYRGDARALAISQNKFSHTAGPAPIGRIVGLNESAGIDQAGCQDMYCEFRVCVTPGIYTLVTFSDDRWVGNIWHDPFHGDQPSFRFDEYTTQFGNPAAPNEMGDWTNGGVGTPDHFSCHSPENAVTIDGRAPSGTKAIYRTFRLNQSRHVSFWGANATCDNTICHRLFRGNVKTVGIAGLTAYTDGFRGDWGCWGNIGTDVCFPLPAGEYTIVTYGNGKTWNSPSYTGNRGQDIGLETNVSMTLPPLPDPPLYNRPHKAAIVNGWVGVNPLIDALPAANFNASSWWYNNDDPNWHPSRSKLSSSTGWHAGHGKCDNFQWVQVDLGMVRPVGAVGTRGRGDTYDQWLTRYVLQYSNDGINFTTLTRNGEDLIFGGNWDRNTLFVNKFPSQISARYWRILPRNWNQCGQSFRWELYESAIQNPIQWCASCDAATFPNTKVEYVLPTERYNCVPDTPFEAHPITSCNVDPPTSCNPSVFNRTTYYKFITTQNSYIRVRDIPSNMMVKLFPLDVTTADSLLMPTVTPVQACFRRSDRCWDGCGCDWWIGEVEFCKVLPGTYTLVLFASNEHVYHSVTPRLVIEKMETTKFDHAQRAYDFGSIAADNQLYLGKNQKASDVTGRALSNDFFTCETGAASNEPGLPDSTWNRTLPPVTTPTITATTYKPDGVTVDAPQENYKCWMGRNYQLNRGKNGTTPYPMPNNHSVYKGWSTCRDNGDSIQWPLRRTLWYTFTADGAGTIEVSVFNRTPSPTTTGVRNETYQPPFSIYRTDEDGNLSFSTLVAQGKVDSILSQGLKFVVNNSFYHTGWWCGGACAGNHQTISFQRDACDNKPTRYYILVDHHVHNELNTQIEVGIRYNPVPVVQVRYDDVTEANVIDGSDAGDGSNRIDPPYDDVALHNGIYTGATGSFICATYLPATDQITPACNFPSNPATIWYKIKVGSFGRMRLNLTSILGSVRDTFYNADNIKLFRQTIPGNFSPASMILQNTNVVTIQGQNWGEVCMSPGVYYIMLTGCNLKFEQVRPRIWLMKDDRRYNHYTQANRINGLNQVNPPYTTVPLGLGTYMGDTTTFACQTKDTSDKNTCGTRTLWYSFDVGISGFVYINFDIFNRFLSTANPWNPVPAGSHVNANNLILYRQIKPGDPPTDSTVLGRRVIPTTQVFQMGRDWMRGCVYPGRYYIMLTGCNYTTEYVVPRIRFELDPGDPCGAPVQLSMLHDDPNPSNEITVNASARVTCHSIGSDFGEDGLNMGCLMGPANYKTTWFKVDITALYKVDLSFQLANNTNAFSNQIQYRVLYGTCDGMTAGPCNSDALTEFTLYCMQSGTYYLQVASPENAVGSISFTIKTKASPDQDCRPINPLKPVANFTASGGCETDSVRFINQSSLGAAITYDWDFGYAGLTSTALNPSVKYPETSTINNYTVRLIVTNTANGAKDTVITTVTTYPKPGGAITRPAPFNTSQVPGGTPIDFLSNATNIVGSPLTTFAWDFGGNSTPLTSTMENPTSVTYTTFGQRVVKLTIRNGTCETFLTDTIVVGFEPIYTGGPNDGSDYAEIPATGVCVPLRFTGGPNDGADFAEEKACIELTFRGGPNDGADYAEQLSPCPPLTHYFGGPSDGADYAEALSPCPGLTLYPGGPSDGADMAMEGIAVDLSSGLDSLCVGGCVTFTARMLDGSAGNFLWMPGNINSATVTLCPTQTTVYTVTASKGSNCLEISETVQVTVYPSPIVDAGDDKLICPGESVRIGYNDPVGLVEPLPASAFSASSWWCSNDDNNWSPVNGKINSIRSWYPGCGQCNANQWIGIDFGQVRAVRYVGTKGRPDGGNDYTTTYKVGFSNDGVNYSMYQEGGVDKIFSGNFDRNTEVRNMFLTVQNFRYARIYPLTWNGCGVIRFEFYTNGFFSDPQPGFHYSWSPTTGLSNPNIYRPLASPLVTTDYTLTITPPAGSKCGPLTDVVRVSVKPTPVTTAKDTILCPNSPAVLEASGQGNYQWYELNAAGTARVARLVTGFNTRQLLTINNLNTTAVTNHQARVVINTQALISAGKMRNDCADLAFSAADGTSMLNFWVESGCNTTNTVAWVKIPSIPASGSVQIYLHYNKPSQTSSLGNGDSTFIFFDDFSGSVINTAKWVEADNSTNYITQTGGRLVVSGGPSNWGTIGAYSVPNFQRPFIFETHYQQTSANYAMIGIKDAGTGVSYTDLVYGAYPVYDGGGNRMQVYEDGNFRGDLLSPISTSMQYHRISVKSAGADYFYSTDNNTFNNYYSNTYSSEVPLKVGTTNYNQAYWLDNVRVRKYAPHELTQTSGAIEDLTGNTDSTVKVTRTGKYIVFSTTGGCAGFPDTVTVRNAVQQSLQYRTRANGNWSDITIWEVWDVINSVWVPAATFGVCNGVPYPTSRSSTILVSHDVVYDLTYNPAPNQSPTNNPFGVDQVTIAPTGIINIPASSNFAIVDSSSSSIAADVQNNGRINVAGALTVVGAGLLVNSDASTVAYINGNQTMWNGQYGNLVVTGGGVKTFVGTSNTFIVRTNVEFDGAHIQLGTRNILLDTLATINGANVGGTNFNKGFFVTNSTGQLFKRRLGTGTHATPEFEFPIGASTTSFNKAIVRNDSTPDRYGMRVYNTFDFDPNFPNDELIAAEAVNRTWNLSENTSGGSKITLRLFWETSHENSPGFLRDQSVLGAYNPVNGWVRQGFHSPAVGTGTSLDPWNQVASNITSVGSFSVGSCGINSLDYRTIKDGNWTDVSIWEVYEPVSGTWKPTSFIMTNCGNVSYPTRLSKTINVRHNVLYNLTIPIGIDQLRVSTTGHLRIPAGRDFFLTADRANGPIFPGAMMPDRDLYNEGRIDITGNFVPRTGAILVNTDSSIVNYNGQDQTMWNGSYGKLWLDSPNSGAVNQKTVGGPNTVVRTELWFINADMFLGDFNCRLMHTARVRTPGQNTGYMIATNNGYCDWVYTPTQKSRLFPIGGVYYSPATIIFDEITTGGSLLGRVREIIHPFLSNAIKRYWTMTQPELSDSGLVFVNTGGKQYRGTFNYHNTDLPSAPDDGPLELAMVIKGCVWNPAHSLPATNNWRFSPAIIANSVDVFANTGTITNWSFSDFTFAPVEDALSIFITNLTGKWTDKQATASDLKWTALGNLSGTTFEVERSTDNLNFTKIGQVNALNGQEFSFIDNQPGKLSDSRYYYRIKVVSSNGMTLYSNIVELTRPSKRLDEAIIAVYPNPVRSNSVLNISYYAPKGGHANLEFYDVIGKRLIEKKIELNDGDTNLELEIGDIPSATYFLSITTNQKVAVKKIIVIK